MAHTVRLDTLDDPRLDAFARLTDHQLRAGRRGGAGACSWRSRRSSWRWRSTRAWSRCRFSSTSGNLSTCGSLLERAGDVPAFVLPGAQMERLCGYRVTRGFLCAMRRPRPRAVEDVLAGARRVVVLEDLVDVTNVGGALSLRRRARRGRRDSLPRAAPTPTSGAPCACRWAASSSSPWGAGRGGLLARADARRPARAGFLGPGARARGGRRAPSTTRRFSRARGAPLLFGSEGYGLSHRALAACDRSVIIPMAPRRRLAERRRELRRRVLAALPLRSRRPRLFRGPPCVRRFRRALRFVLISGFAYRPVLISGFACRPVLSSGFACRSVLISGTECAQLSRGCSDADLSAIGRPSGHSVPELRATSCSTQRSTVGPVLRSATAWARAARTRPPRQCEAHPRAARALSSASAHRAILSSASEHGLARRCGPGSRAWPAGPNQGPVPSASSRDPSMSSASERPGPREAVRLVELPAQALATRPSRLAGPRVEARLLDPEVAPVCARRASPGSRGSS